jgi:hypothetical protein
MSASRGAFHSSETAFSFSTRKKALREPFGIVAVTMTVRSGGRALMASTTTSQPLGESLSASYSATTRRAAMMGGMANAAARASGAASAA